MDSDTYWTKSNMTERHPEKKDKFGHNWTSKLYFDPEADKKSGKIFIIDQITLMEKLPKLEGVDQYIKEVTIYKHPLFSWQPRIFNFILYHNFVLFETGKWWWTIEKDSEGITIQRSEYCVAVRDKYRQKDRITHYVDGSVLCTKCKLSVNDLIVWLYNEKELEKAYSAYWSNCKHFATAVFNYVSRSKKC